MSLDGMFARLDAPTVGYHQSYYVEDSILTRTPASIAGGTSASSTTGSRA